MFVGRMSAGWGKCHRWTISFCWRLVWAFFPVEFRLESPSSSWSRKWLGEQLLSLDENQDCPVQTWPLDLGQTRVQTSAPWT